MGLRDYIPTLIKPESGHYVIHERKGKVIHEGEGISFWYINALDNYTLVSLNPNNLEFCVDQASKEWQGVEVIGMASWKVVDPKNSKSYLDIHDNRVDTQKVSDRLSAMITSAIRYQIANTSIEDAMRKRGALLNEFKENELLEISKKWGINVDPFEITNVRIMSPDLFTIFQIKYREGKNLEAEKSKMQTNDKISQESLENKKRETQRQYELEREKRQYETKAKQNDLETAAELERIEVENKFDIDKYRSEKDFEHGRYLQELEFELTKLKKKYENAILAVDKDRYGVEGEIQELRSELERKATDVEVECKKRLAEVDKLKVSISNEDKNSKYQKIVETARELKELNIGRLDIGLSNPFDYFKRLIKDLGDYAEGACSTSKKLNFPDDDSRSAALKEPIQ